MKFLLKNQFQFLIGSFNFNLFLFRLTVYTCQCHVFRYSNNDTYLPNLSLSRFLKLICHKHCAMLYVLNKKWINQEQWIEEFYIYYNSYFSLSTNHIHIRTCFEIGYFDFCWIGIRKKNPFHNRKTILCSPEMSPPFKKKWM